MAIEKIYMRNVIIGLFTLVLFVLNGCVTHIHPSMETNIPPTERLSVYNRFELLPLKSANSEVAAQSSALAKIQENINHRLKSRLDIWNSKPVNGPIRTLVIQPTITQLKFVSGGKRFWFGALAGSSAVIMQAMFTEKETGREIANPEFYARAQAYAGTWTFGTLDNIMLVRIANSLAVYVFSNYQHATGGPVMPTDVEAEKVLTE